MKPRGLLYVALATIFNIILYAATYGRYVWLEGRVRGGVFNNWAKRFRYRPKRFFEPTTEAEIVDIINSSKEVRLFGAGHSFNSAVVSDDTLVSLDKYCGEVWKDKEKKQISVRGGTRVRDVVRLLLEEGLAFKALPSHDAQSIAGILSTDVHGTGRDWGFVSESVVNLKLINGKGEVHTCQPTDELFKAAIGGIGAVGIISEVTVQGVDRFNVEQKFQISDLPFVKNNFERLLRENDHLSLYLFPFTDKCQISTWNRTTKKQTFLGQVWEFVSISKDALLAACFGNLMAYSGRLPALSSFTYSFKRGTNLVMESHKAFNRTIYHLHQELEFAVPLEDTFDICQRFIKLYEEMYPAGLPYTLFEVRFTPAGHDRTLIGAGRERHFTWIDLVCTDSYGYEKYYAAAEELIKEIGARPHLGKFCQSLRKDDLAKLHQNHFARFLQLMKEQDPENKFANEFTRRLFLN